MIQRRTLVKAVIAALAPLSMTSAFAAGGPSGAHIGYQHQGQLGAVDMNPYKIAPLTAIIRDAGFTIQNIHVRIVPKANGQEIAYKVTNQKAKTYGGIPVFGLYPDYVNTVEVSYTKVAGDKREEIKESYRIYAPPVYFYATGARDQKNMDMNPEVKKVDPEFKDRLYFINNQILNSWKTGQFTWNNPNDMDHPPTQCVTTKRCAIMGVYQLR
ncbi:aryl-sulfate sulfotransferase N-terminal domain-containing protein, partial [Sutterella wadsworthensis]|uniref:aryl-sulfate sulfotransferase N-terminal domain-containing protein n=1 Tax=Sutterella wadsworthensis TaxID=40545 RepID=UPI0032C1C4E7